MEGQVGVVQVVCGVEDQVLGSWLNLATVIDFATRLSTALVKVLPPADNYTCLLTSHVYRIIVPPYLAFLSIAARYSLYGVKVSVDLEETVLTRSALEPQVLREQFTLHKHKSDLEFIHGIGTIMQDGGKPITLKLIPKFFGEMCSIRPKCWKVVEVDIQTNGVMSDLHNAILSHNLLKVQLRNQYGRCDADELCVQLSRSMRVSLDFVSDLTNRHIEKVRNNESTASSLSTLEKTIDNTRQETLVFHELRVASSPLPAELKVWTESLTASTANLMDLSKCLNIKIGDLSPGPRGGFDGTTGSLSYNHSTNDPSFLSRSLPIKTLSIDTSKLHISYHLSETGLDEIRVVNPTAAAFSNVGFFIRNTRNTQLSYFEVTRLRGNEAISILSSATIAAWVKKGGSSLMLRETGQILPLRK